MDNPPTRNGGKYPVHETTLAELQTRFTYHQPAGDQPERYALLRQKMFDIAVSLATSVPPCRERDRALEHLEQASMWANAGISRREIDAAAS